MAKANAKRRVAAIISAAIEAGGQGYLEAVAAEIDGSDPRRGWQRFQEVLRKAYILASLEGMAAAYTQARIRAKAPPVEAERVQAADVQLDRFAKGIEVVFEEGPFLEALRGFEARVPRLRAQVKRLVDESLSLSQAVTMSERTSVVSALQRKSEAVQKAMSSSFYVTDVDKRTVVNLQALVGEALRGENPRGVSGFIDEAQLQGAANLTRARLETVYRNNLSSAANAGTVEVHRDPEVRATIPLLMLEEIMDRRTRGNPAGLYPDQGVHFQMDGYVGTIEEFERRGIIPPNGHNCRGGVRGIPLGEAESLGFVADDGQLVPQAIAAHNGNRTQLLDSGQYPDPGFLAA